MKTLVFGSANIDRTFSVPHIVAGGETIAASNAGDTYTGYFLASVMAGRSVADSMKTAAAASGISMSRKGASPSIPRADEVSEIDFLHIK